MPNKWRQETSWCLKKGNEAGNFNSVKNGFSRAIGCQGTNMCMPFRIWIPRPSLFLKEASILLFYLGWTPTTWTSHTCMDLSCSSQTHEWDQWSRKRFPSLDAWAVESATGFPSAPSPEPFLPSVVPSPPAFHLRRGWELGLSPQHPCGQANSAKARRILKGSVHDVSTYIFPRQLVDQKNKLCLISLISPKVMPRKALKHILFLFCICNSIIWLGVGCQWVIKQYFLTLHYVQNIVLDVGVESLEKSRFLIAILQRKYH